MKKVLHITPHLSTGGLPQFLLSLLRSTNDLVENYCVEYACHSLDFVVQRAIDQGVGFEYHHRVIINDTTIKYVVGVGEVKHCGGKLNKKTLNSLTGAFHCSQ